MNIHPLEELIILYLLEKDITKGTKSLYLAVFKDYINYLKDKEIYNITTLDLSGYIEHEKNKGYTNGWIYHQIGTLKAFYRYLSIHYKRLDLPKSYAYDISEPIKNVSLKTCDEKKTLTPEEAKKLILYLKLNRKYIWHYRDYALIYLMITTGMRSIEIRRSRIKDIKVIKEKFVLYIQGKGQTSKDDYVKLTPGVKEALNDYLNKRNDKNPYLFISHSKHSDIKYLSRGFFNGMIKRVLHDSGIKDKEITPHTLRHTSATLNLMRGGTLKQTQKLLRHTSISTTLIYAHHLKNIKYPQESQIESYILESKDNT